MGYNGSNRNPKFDVFSKKGLSNSDIGFILVLILIPIIPIIFIVLLIIEIINGICDGETDTNEDDEKEQIKMPSQYNRLITDLSESIKDKNSIRANYLTVVQTNDEIERKIKELNSDIDAFKHKLKKYGFIPNIKKKNIEGIKIAHREIHRLKSLVKTPIVGLEEYKSSNHTPISITGHCLLLINRILKTGDLLEEKDVCRRLEEKKSFLEITQPPNLKLSFAPLELFFYDDMILLMTEDDFVVLERDEYELDFRTEKRIKGIGVHYPTCSYYWNMNIIDIKTYSQTISIHFVKEQEGKLIYDLISSTKK